MFTTEQRIIKKHDGFDRVICITPEHIHSINNKQLAPHDSDNLEPSTVFVAYLTNERFPSPSFSPEDGSEIVPQGDSKEIQIPDFSETKRIAHQLTMLRQSIYERILGILDQNHLPSISYDVSLDETSGCIIIRCMADTIKIIEEHLNSILPGKNYSASASPFHGFQIPPAF